MYTPPTSGRSAFFEYDSKVYFSLSFPSKTQFFFTHMLFTQELALQNFVANKQR